ncbi:hypothetical protein B9Z55_024772 [Caenorhabditis nigoni]|nr:hypothetical protein B9Z55_024772 [Caenorhabditis nigoni]
MFMHPRESLRNLATKRQCAKCSRAEELGTSNFSDCQPRQLISYFERKATILMHRLSMYEDIDEDLLIGEI